MAIFCADKLFRLQTVPIHSYSQQTDQRHGFELKRGWNHFDVWFRQNDQNDKYFK